jgi:hypothetical protein
MSWSYKFIGVDNHGKILTLDDVSGIVGDFSLEQSIGDEFIVSSGDISIKHNSDLPFTSLGGPSKYWLGFYWNNVLFDAFRIKKGFDKKSLKFSNKYESRLQSIQKSFFEDAEAIVVKDDSSDATSWGYNVINAAYVVGELGYWYKSGTTWTPYFYTDGRYAFGLPPLIRSIGDHNAHNDKGYRLASLTCPGPAFVENDMPFLYRGASSTVRATAIQAAFETPGVTWFDILKLTSIIFNAFIRVKPKVYDIGGDDHLGVDIEILPRSVFSGSPSEFTWLDANFDFNKLNVAAVKIASEINSPTYNRPVFEWSYGDLLSKNIQDKTLTIANPTVDGAIEDNANNLFLVAGDWISGEYDVMEDTEKPEIYFKDAYLLAWYEDLIDSAYGVDGEIRFNGEQCGDIATVPGSLAGLIVRTNKLTIKKSGKATISGISV